MKFESRPGKFFIEDRYLGEALIPPYPDHSVPFSRAYFCQTCGRIWARIDTGASYNVFSKYCARCPRNFSHDILGSVILAWDPEVFQNLPLGVLAWELERHLEWHSWIQKTPSLTLQTSNPTPPTSPLNPTKTTTTASMGL